MGEPQVNFTVVREQAEHFSKVWKTPSGLSIVMTPMSLQFATDFANIVIKSFIMDCQLKAQAAATIAAQKAAKPVIELVKA